MCKISIEDIEDEGILEFDFDDWILILMKCLQKNLYSMNTEVN